jgi:hypothetical protein
VVRRRQTRLRRSGTDPVSWKVVEAGWPVVGADGTDLGRVHELVGDAKADIFNGLNVSPGLLRASRYVPAEHVAKIVEGRVTLDLSRRDFRRLRKADAAPASAEIRSDTSELPEDAPPRE